MLRREGKQFRQMIFDRITGVESGESVDWGKMAVKTIFDFGEKK